MSNGYPNGGYSQGSYPDGRHPDRGHFDGRSEGGYPPSVSIPAQPNGPYPGYPAEPPDQHGRVPDLPREWLDDAPTTQAPTAQAPATTLTNPEYAPYGRPKEQMPSAGQTEQAKPKKPGRDRYLDLLRTLALVRVVVYHIFGWAWLSVAFPSMGVMFALAGSLMARSLKRGALSVIKDRLRRLLPPMWLFSAVALTILYLQDWDIGLKVINYIVPFGAPAFPEEIGSESGLFESTWADQGVGPMWYLRAYMWFVIASPLLLWLFRRVPWVALLAPLALTAVVGTGLVEIPGETGLAVTDFAVYGGCWVLGMAHHEGWLAKVPRYASVSWAAILMALGLWWASGHLGESGWDLNDIPLAQALWSFGIVTILLQYSPSWQELPGRLRNWDRVVTLFNSRAMTIYLWHNLLIMFAFYITDQLYSIPFLASDRAATALDKTGMLWSFFFVWPLIGLAILAFGWIEDIAAKRSPRLWPDGSRASRRAAARGRG